MALTREQKKEIAAQVEDFVTNMLGPIEPEDLEEVGDFILKEVEDEIASIEAWQSRPAQTQKAPRQ